jgi:hypothetical protein
MTGFSYNGAMLIRSMQMLLPLLVLSVAMSSLQSVQPTSSVAPPSSTARVALVQLSPPVYPAIARTALITGDIKVQLSIRSDGSVESATRVSGDSKQQASVLVSILEGAALDSARQSHFSCRDCNEGSATYFLTYTFQFAQQTDRCCCSDMPAGKRRSPVDYPQIKQSEDHITLIAAPPCVCPDACTMERAEKHSKYRSAKCLFLWKCGHRSVVVL